MALARESNAGDGRDLNHVVIKFARPPGHSSFDNLDQALHEWRLRKLAGHHDQSAPRNKHPRDFMTDELGVEEVQSIRHHHEVQASSAEWQVLGGCVEG